jgi:hypothetical protein
MFERTIFLASGLDESKELRLQDAFQVRTYTAKQFRRLLDSGTVRCLRFPVRHRATVLAE